MTMTRGRLGQEVSATRDAARVAATLLGLAVRSLIGWPLRVMRARRLMGELAAMGENGLRDIGLTLQDVRDAAGLPPGRDPGGLLQRRASERRQADLSWRARRNGNPRR